MKGSTCWIDIPPPHEVFKCAQCHKANHIADCSGVAVCNKATEVCYVEEETDIGGETVHCDGIGCFNEVGGTRERRDVLRRLQRRDVTELTTPDFLTPPPSMHSDKYRCPIFGVNNTWISTAPPTTTTTTEPTTTTPPPEPTCEDLEDCAVYGYDYACTGNFYSWAKVNCRKFCGYCTAATTTPVLTPTCEDLEDCSVYGHDYACSAQYEEWARTTCPKFCGYCNPVMMRRAAHDTAYSVRNASPTAMKTPVPAMVVFTTMLVMFGVV
ncbi:hypothetical protein MAR_033344 [Mya arenaria]|uniref:ShKT domain-containing protein n=1 Tax=Mya arenaria TaxID=6604 RepID=A0ABY7G8R6_MYAAR|nr:hypothetical protein MAR_033344 [Mya arenaria]